MTINMNKINNLFMTKFFLVVCLLLGSTAGWGQTTSITFEIEKANADAKPYVTIGQQTKQSADGGSMGRRVVRLDIDKPAYVTVHFSKLDSRLCYVEPGKDLVLKYSMPQGSKSLAFGGSLAKENTHILNYKWAGPLPFSTKRTIDQSIAGIDSLCAIDKARLKQMGFSPTFTEWEMKRMETHALEQMLRIHTKENATLKARLQSRVVKDADWLRLPNYMHLADQYIRLLVRMDVGLKKTLEGEELADKRISCIEENIAQPDIKAYLIDITLFHLGELNIPRYNDIYHRYVKEPQRLALYDASTRKALKMAQGQPCPDFTFADNKGGKVSLADLKGKFVYIDLWATWCGPCKGEMPALLELEKKFEGKDLLFVSLSVDSNKNIDLWKKTIDKMGLQGIQLHLGEQWDWLKTFMPSSISVPRFIILDREGRIIDAHAPRPSDKGIAEKLEALIAGQQPSAGISFFQGTYEEALAEAGRQNKLLFIDCYADWCGPCHKMAKEIFTQQRVGEMFNKNFICLMSNMEKNAAGKALRDRFNVVSYPTLLFVSPEGFVTQRRNGFAPTDSLLAFARKALEGGRKSDERRFAEGDRDAAFLKAYVRTLCANHQADDVEKLLGTLYEERGTELLEDADYWKAYVMCAEKNDSPLALGFVSAFNALCSVHGDYAVKQKMRNIFASFSVVLSFYDTIDRKERFNEKRMKDYFAQLKKRRVPDSRLLQEELEYLVKLKQADYKGAYAWGEKCLKKADARTLCNWVAWGERIVRGDKELRRQLVQWADRAIAQANGNEAIVTECNNVKRDLLASPNPVISFKGKNARTTIPIRGY